MTKPIDNLTPAWQAGYPPDGEFVAIACRKWSGMHEGRYLEVVAGDPAMFLQFMGITPLLEPGVTVIYGKVETRNDMPYFLGEHGSPAGFYPDAVLGWSRVPEFLVDLKAAAVTNMVLQRAQGQG